MITFKKMFLGEGVVEKLQHLSHLEDLILDTGIAGLRDSILFLLDIRNMLAGQSNGKINVTVKFDGAPSIVCGINPENGRFFVGTKGVFAKTPKLYYTQNDVRSADIPEGLANKLSVALAEFPKLGIKGVLQGDFLFTKEDLKIQSYNNEALITFRPNTITYAVPKDSDIGREILKAKAGIVFHTQYSGYTIGSLKASFGVDSSSFKKVQSVWVKDAYFRDVSGEATFDKKEYDLFTDILSEIGQRFHGLDGNLVSQIIGNDELRNFIKQFNNMKVRQGEAIIDTKKHVQDLSAYIFSKYSEDINKLKTDRGKENRRVAMTSLVKDVLRNKGQLKLIFDLQNLLVFAKDMVLKKLQTASDLGTFIDTGNGLQVTAPEGFVAADHVGNAIKLVSRLEFSRLNFNIPKNW